MLKSKAGIEINIANYRRRAGPALNDLLGGHIDAMIDAMPVMSVQAKEGKGAPIAVNSAKRSAAMPDVPTMQEAGFPDYEMYGWFEFLPRTGTLAAIAQKLRDEVAKAVADAGVVKMLGEQGMEPLATQPAEWQVSGVERSPVYAKITKDANIKP